MSWSEGVASLAKGVIVWWQTEYMMETSEEEAITETESSSTDASSGTLDHSLVLASALRQRAIAGGQPPKNLSRLFYEYMDLHDLVNQSKFARHMVEQPDEDIVCKYYSRILEGLGAAEALWIEADFEGKETIDLNEYFRTAALKADLQALGLPADEALNEKVKTHPEKMRALAAECPKLLLPHLAIWYYAVLHGGRKLGEVFTQKGLPAQSHGLTLPMLTALSRKIDAFGKTLTPKERERFADEMITAWVHAGECVDIDISKEADAKRAPST